MTRKLTIIESPFAAKPGSYTTDETLVYLHRCLRDSWERGELPFASHGFFPSFLNEFNPAEREEGIEAGYAFWNFRSVRAEAPQDELPSIAFYVDLGMSPGMQKAHDRCLAQGRTTIIRTLERS